MASLSVPEKTKLTKTVRVLRADQVILECMKKLGTMQFIQHISVVGIGMYMV